jgi:tripeptide aminopeptidase
MKRASLLLMAAGMLGGGEFLAAQQAIVPSANPDVRTLLTRLAESERQTIESQIALCQIPAPPFGEARRAEAFRRRLVEAGIEKVWIDSVGNVIGELPGTPGKEAVVISGHLDTVFPEETDVTVKRDGAILRGPGIEDNCRGLAVVAAVAEAVVKGNAKPDATVYFVGTVGEEGPGNLRGVRHLFERELAGKAEVFISIDAGSLSAIKDAVGSYRYTVTIRAAGGHSYSAFGRPNAIHAMGRAIAALADLEVPDTPRTTFSVGIVEGGTTVNAMAEEASFQIDMRSLDPAYLGALDSAFRIAVEQAVAAEERRWEETGYPLKVEFDRWGDRPAGMQSDDAPIVRAARASAQELGITARFSPASTDANLPISLGIPSVVIGGGGKGTGAHTLSESWDSTDSHLGTQWAALLLLTVAGVR